MIRKHILAISSALLLVITLSGCAVEPSDVTDPIESAAAAAGAMPQCNLGVRIDRELNVVRARYDAPPADSYDVKHYGPLIANQGCSDAEILAWQELRRDEGESDEICRVVLKQTVDAVVFPIGCAVPVLVVTDAVR